MNISHLIKKPMDVIVCEQINVLGSQVYLPAKNKIFSGTSGSQLGVIMRRLDFDFPVSLLTANTSGRNFTTKDPKYYFLETGNDKQILNNNLMITKGEDLVFMSLADFVIHQEVEYLKTLSGFQKWKYLTRKKIDSILSKIFK